MSVGGAARLRRCDEHASQYVRGRLAVLDPVGEHMESERDGARQGLVASCSVNHAAGQVRNVSDPSVVGLAVDLDGEPSARLRGG